MIHYCTSIYYGLEVSLTACGQWIPRPKRSRYQKYGQPMFTSVLSKITCSYCLEQRIIKAEIVLAKAKENLMNLRYIESPNTKI